MQLKTKIMVEQKSILDANEERELSSVFTSKHSFKIHASLTHIRKENRTKFRGIFCPFSLIKTLLDFITHWASSLAPLFFLSICLYIRCCRNNLISKVWTTNIFSLVQWSETNKLVLFQNKNSGRELENLTNKTKSINISP